MKDLELIIYPKLERPKNGAELYPYRQQIVRERYLRETKRLTDAELAAEYWRAKHSGMRSVLHGVLTKEKLDKIATVARFYRLPHYDEAQS